MASETPAWTANWEKLEKTLRERPPRLRAPTKANPSGRSSCAREYLEEVHGAIFGMRAQRDRGEDFGRDDETGTGQHNLQFLLLIMDSPRYHPMCSVLFYSTLNTFLGSTCRAIPNGCQSWESLAYRVSMVTSLSFKHHLVGPACRGRLHCKQIREEFDKRRQTLFYF